MSSASRRRHSHHEEHENNERWLVSYADFITLLFAFFTVLYATSQQDADKAKQFEQSIRKFFGAVISTGSGEGGSTTGVGSGFEATRNFIESPIRHAPDINKGSLA